jgi:tRNA (guanine37-N1)-methyltransferase
VRIDVITIFPGIFDGPTRESLLGKAVEGGTLDVRVHDLRDFTTDHHRQVDDEPYGGGPGMVMKPEPVVAAVEALAGGSGEGGPVPRVVLLSPAGRRLDQPFVRELAAEPWLILVCGRYEGIDERVVEAVGAEEVSIGDYVLAGGEVPALVLLEAVSRLVPGVVGTEASLSRESFEEEILDHPHYTRPRDFRGLEVPDVLLSGNHAEIERWRREAAEAKTRRNRPDLLSDGAPPEEQGGAGADR